ncbi:MAG: penicillin-binding protein activator LpoB [Nitrospiraceae bacterium]|nr:MAG: penicillin-binding protein activator LpoB [Nitrospiraceae bacterium]
MTKHLSLLLICIGLIIAGCSPDVKRVDTDEVIDLSGRWNDTDSRLVAEEMIQDALDRPWIRQFMQKNNGNVPVVIVGTVQNLSHEHINVQTFVKDLERSLINSGEVEFVSSREERVELREERVDQAYHASEKTVKKDRMETGADFMLQGSINSILDRTNNKAVMFYQVNLELTDLESHKKVWIGDKKIKKLIKRPDFKP